MISGDRATRPNQVNSQIKGSLACSRNMGGARGSEENIPSLGAIKGTEGREVPSDSQDPVKLTLQ